MILYQRLADNSFRYAEVTDLQDYDTSSDDGRLYKNNDDNNLWWVLDVENPVDLFECDDEYVMALVAYRLENPKLFRS